MNAWKYIFVNAMILIIAIILIIAWIDYAILAVRHDRTGRRLWNRSKGSSADSMVNEAQRAVILQSKDGKVLTWAIQPTRKGARPTVRSSSGYLRYPDCLLLHTYIHRIEPGNKAIHVPITSRPGFADSRFFRGFFPGNGLFRSFAGR